MPTQPRNLLIASAFGLIVAIAVWQATKPFSPLNHPPTPPAPTPAIPPPTLAQGLTTQILNQIDISYSEDDLPKLTGQPLPTNFPHHPAARSMAEPRAISDDASTLAYIISLPVSPPSPTPRNEWLLLNKTPGPRFDQIQPETVRLSPDGKHLAYAALTGTTWSMIHDGQPGQPYRSILNTLFSPNGSRLAYSVARQDYAQCHVVDNHESDPFEHSTPLVFSPDSKHYAFAASNINRKGWRLILDGKQIAGDSRPLYPRTLTFSPDGSRIAVVVQNNSPTDDSMMIFVDGQFGPPFFDLLDSSPHFSPDSQRFVYAAGDVNHNYFLLDNGKPSQPFNFIFPDSIRFTPDNRLTYLAGTGPRDHSKYEGTPSRGSTSSIPAGTPTLFLEGQPPSPHAVLQPPVFSADGKHLAYYGQSPHPKLKGFVNAVIIDGKPDPASADVRLLTLSPDGKHYAYICSSNPGTAPYLLVLDGTPHTLLDVWILNMTLDNSASITATLHNTHGLYLRALFK